MQVEHGQIMMKIAPVVHEAGQVYRHPDGMVYLAAVHGELCYLVNLESGSLRCAPDYKAITEAHMRSQRMVQIPAIVQVP